MLTSLLISFFWIGIFLLLPPQVFNFDRNWIFYILLSLGPGLLFLIPNWNIQNIDRFKKGFGALVILAACSAVYLNTPDGAPVWIFVAVIGLSVFLAFFEAGFQELRTGWMRVLVLAVVVSSSFGFRNVEFIGTYLIQKPILTVFGFFATLLIWKSEKSEVLNSFFSKAVFVKMCAFGFFFGVVVSLAFRDDQISHWVSVYNWEYFIGPLRAWKSGFTPLWSIPSQYGFLNVFLAGIIPVEHLWDQFRIFQALLMTLNCFVFYWIVVKISEGQHRPYYLIALPLIYFFVDPALSGPQPYPSTSALRFLPFFIFWLVLVSRHLFTLSRFLFLMGAVVSLSSIWSFEACAYVLAPAIVIFAYQLKIAALARKEFLSLFVGLISINGFFAIFFLLSQKKWPEFSMIAEFAMSYAKGFGGLSMDRWRATFFLLHGFCSITVALAFQKNRDRQMILCAAAASWWILSSYYVGRSTSENVLTLFPELFLLLLIVESQVDDQKKYYFRSQRLVIFLLIAVPFFVGVKDVNFSAFNWTVENNMSRADVELSEMIQKSGIQRTDPVVLYSLKVGPKAFVTDEGVWMPERTWLANPLQLLEEPISEKRREEILTRELQENNYQRGFIIVDLQDHLKERWMNWLTVFAKVRPIEVVAESERWKIYRTIGP